MVAFRVIFRHCAFRVTAARHYCRALPARARPVVAVLALCLLAHPLDAQLATLSHRRAAFRSGSTAPDDISGLVLWLKADEITGLSDGDGVSSWPDSSAENNDASQANAPDRPTYETNELNGLPVVRFDGAWAYMTVAYDAGLALTGNITCFAVASWDNFSSGDHETVWAFGAHSNNNLNVIFGKYDGDVLKFTYNDGSFRNVLESSSWTGTNTTRYIVAWRVDQDDDDVEFRVDGATESTVADANNLNIQTGDNTGGAVGANLTAGELFDGDIAEIILYSRYLTAAEVEDVEQYLSTKYNISLP